MFVRITFEVDPLQVPDLKYKLRLDQLPVGILSLLGKSNEITVVEEDRTENYVYLSWRAELAKWPTDASTLVAALRLVWRVHKWTTQYAVKLEGFYVS